MCRLFALEEKLEIIIKTITIYMVHSLSSLKYDQRIRVLSENHAVRSTMRTARNEPQEITEPFRI